MALAARAAQPRFFYSTKKKNHGNLKVKLKKVGRTFGYSLLAIALIVSALFLYKYTVTNQYFQIKSVEVKGVTRLSVNKLLNDMEPFLSGNIFTADIKRATEYLEKNPWVAFASIRRKLPGSLEVAITERYPVAVAMLEKPYLIDWQGYLLEETDKLDGRVVIAGFSKNEILGDKINDSRLEDAYRLIDIFSRDTVFNDPVRYVDIGNPDAIMARTEKSGLDIWFGPKKENWEEKFLEYLTVRKILADRGTTIRKINLSFKNQVVVVKGEKELLRSLTN